MRRPAASKALRAGAWPQAQQARKKAPPPDATAAPVSSMTAPATGGTAMAASQAARIDIHHHFFAPEYLAAMGSGMANRPEVKGWSLERTFEEMDKNGVAAAMLSLSPPGIHLGDRDATKKLARAINEHAAKLRAAHPARFGHFASVPMPNMDDAVAEIAYAPD